MLPFVPTLLANRGRGFRRRARWTVRQYVVDGLVPLAHQVIDDSGRAAILVGVNGGAVVGGGFADEHDWKFSRRLVSDEIGDAFLQHYDDTIHRLTLHAIDGGGKRAFRTVAHGLDGD